MLKRIGITLSLILIAPVVWGYSPIYRMPPIEGTVTDAVTGKPIENVVVEAWGFMSGLPSPFTGGIVPAWGERAITDKDGRYRIPGKIHTDLLGRFIGVQVELNHPLYERIGGSSGPHIYWNEKAIKEMKKGKDWDGVIHHNQSLMSLEDKKNNFYYFLEVQRGWWWYKLYKKTGVTYDWEAIFRKWEEIAATKKSTFARTLIFEEINRMKNEIDEYFNKGGEVLEEIERIKERAYKKWGGRQEYYDVDYKLQTIKEQYFNKKIEREDALKEIKRIEKEFFN